MGRLKKAAQGFRPSRLGQPGLLAEFESLLIIYDQISAHSDTTLLGRTAGGVGVIECERS